MLAKELPTPQTMGTKLSRGKRGLVNILGYGMKYLFGTTDAKDVLRLTRVCDELHVFEMQVAHSAEQQLTYLRYLDDDTKRNTKHIIELAKVLRDSIRNFAVQLHRTEAGLVDTQKMIEKQTRYIRLLEKLN